MNAFEPYSLWKHLSFRIFAVLLCVALAILLVVPMVIRWGAVRWLHGQGQVHAEIEDVDFNPFSGELSVASLLGAKEEGSRLNARMTMARIDWWPFFERRLFVPKAVVNGAVIDAWISDDGTVRVGRINVAGGPAEEPSAGQTGTAWGFGFGAVDLEDVQVRLHGPRLVTDIMVHRLHVGALRSWEPGVSTPLDADLEVDGGRLRVGGTVQPYASQPILALSVSIDGYPLGRMEPIVDAAGLSHLAGIITMKGDIRAALPDREAPGTLGYDGTISLGQFELARASDGSRLEAGSAHIEGSVKIQFREKTPVVVATDGTLQLDSLNVAVPFVNEGSKPQDKAGGTEKTEGPAYFRVAFDGTLRWEDLATEISTAAAEEPLDSTAAGSVPPLRASRVQIAEGGSLTLKDERVTPPMELALSSVRITALDLDTIRKDATTRISAEATVGRRGTVRVEGQATPIGSLQDGEANARLERIPLLPFTGYAERYLGYRIRSGSLDIASEATVAGRVLRANNEVELLKFELEHVPGHERADIEGRLGLPLNAALGLLRDKDKGIRISVPVEGDLTNLEIGVGDAVAKAIGNATLKAMQTASISYFAPVLASFAGPLGAALAAGKLVSLATALRFAPVPFPPGSAELERGGTTYLDTLGTLLNDRPEVQITICGTSVPADAAAMADRKGKAPGKGAPPDSTGGAADAPGKPGQGDAAGLPEDPGTAAVSEGELRDLADQRARSVEHYLVETAGIDHKRLFLCAPTVSTDANLAPGVDISL